MRLVAAPDDEAAARIYLVLGGTDDAALAVTSPMRYDLVRPALAAACVDVAGHAPPAAKVLLLERALSLPFTDADRERLTHMWSSSANWQVDAARSAEQWRPSLCACTSRAGLRHEHRS